MTKKGQTTQTKPLGPNGTKWCPDCCQHLPFEAFSSSRSRPGGCYGYCRTCANKRNRGYYSKNSGIAMTAGHYRRTYGLSVKQYMALHDQQGGTCAICGEKEEGVHWKGKTKRLAVDHCHETGKVRGLLCSRCNTALGLLRDSTALLQKAASYLVTTGTGLEAPPNP